MIENRGSARAKDGVLRDDPVERALRETDAPDVKAGERRAAFVSGLLVDPVLAVFTTKTGWYLTTVLLVGLVILLVASTAGWI